MFFFLKAASTTEIYTLSLHDALPILAGVLIGLIIGVLTVVLRERFDTRVRTVEDLAGSTDAPLLGVVQARSEEHTSELQSRPHLVCRLLLEKKKHKQYKHILRSQEPH